ncbi:MAG: 2-oxoacid:ferredoxin oxidoreductase subunit beta [Elusimicrobia bacterium]|jgi:2-oxoglutarate ferredoxin oxidoreductase subunit beta|nr:2-oxoacid:ferredoxin oxidoreductase subunit beta [Elusimicrobiota bacterium]
MIELATPQDASKFRSEIKPTWCPGCGDFGVLNSLQTACATLKINPKDLVVVSGIGCSSNLPGFIHSYGMHTLHGRGVAVAQGVKLGNTDLTVVATGGDGDGYGIGVGHFVHAVRRNINMTYVVMNNQIYGLTTGQASPTTSKAHKTKSTPAGNLENALNPLGIALMAGASFVARGFSGDSSGLAEIMTQAIAHKGFSLIDVLSPCVTYNKMNTYAWFRERVYKLQEKGHDVTNMEAALKASLDWDQKIATGVLYQVERPTYEEQDPAMSEFGPLVKHKLGLSDDDWKAVVQEFM